MGQIIVRNLDDAVIARLKAMAKHDKTSLEQTVRKVLGEAAKPADRSDLTKFAADMRARTADRGPDLDVVAEIRRDRDTDHGREWP